VPLTNEDDIISGMEKALTELADHPERLEGLRRQAIAYVRECLTWDAKAHSVARVLEWVARRASKPDLPPPKMLCPQNV
jgi:glycosyltransferase involved in cell wall biosynthesis